MKSSCLSHPANNSFLKIHKWQMIACRNNSCSAALLSFFEEIANSDNTSKHLREKFQTKSALLLTDVGIPLKLNVLKNELMSVWSERKISESLLLLSQLGFIKLSNSSNPYDRTKYIRFYPEACTEWIKINYSANGEYIKSQNNHVDSEILNDRKSETTVPRRPKSRSTKKDQSDKSMCSITKSKETDKSSLNAFVLNRRNSQPYESNENAIFVSRGYPKSVSKISKCILNINQTRSININQAKSIAENHLNKNKGTVSSDEHPVVTALLQIGFEKGKFNYPDVLPSILDLELKGATPKIYLEAFDIAKSVSGIKGFGVKYINRIVEDILKRDKKLLNKPKKHTQPIIKSDEFVTEIKNDLSNALQWTSLYSSLSENRDDQ